MIEIFVMVVLFLVILFSWQEEDFDDLASVFGVSIVAIGLIWLITSIGSL